MLGSAFIFGSITGGLNAYKEQDDINTEACNYFDAIKDYQTASNAMLEGDLMKIGEYSSAIYDLNDKMSDLMSSIRTKHKNFKNSYNLYTVIFIIFIVFVIFILITKKIIYKAHTE